MPTNADESSIQEHSDIPIGSDQIVEAEPEPHLSDKPLALQYLESHMGASELKDMLAHHQMQNIEA